MIKLVLLAIFLSVTIAESATTTLTATATATTATATETPDYTISDFEATSTLANRSQYTILPPHTNTFMGPGPEIRAQFPYSIVYWPGRIAQFIIPAVGEVCPSGTFAPDWTSCEHFLTCENGLFVQSSCPAGQQYDGEGDWCSAPYNQCKSISPASLQKLLQVSKVSKNGVPISYDISDF